MKLDHLNIVIVFLLFVVSCSKEVQSNNLVERNGIKYEINSQTPFSGNTLDFYPNGQYKEVIYYKKGKPHGQKDRFYENGQLASTGNYIDGNEDGVWDRYDILGLKENYKDGKLKSKGNFKDGKEDGPWEFYGTIATLEKGNFKEGKKDGVWTTYFQDGQVHTISFKDGILNGPNHMYRPDGTLAVLHNYLNGEQDGYQLFISSDGKRYEDCFSKGEKVDCAF